MADFHEVRLPLRLALASSGGPTRRTDIVRLSNGRESRNARWMNARRRYEVGSSVKTLDDLYEIISFFEARRGQLHGFRFRDPLDHKSCAPGLVPSSGDQPLGTGDGETRIFDITKVYGDAGGSSVRRIAKPVAGTIMVARDGVPLSAFEYATDTTAGTITFADHAVPPPGATLTAGFEFDVPVRFNIDNLDINLTAFRAGQVPTLPLVEIVP
ncbi:DUF2460 domain-containing protein [Pararhizobium haloflavum]|uniref:DUF2460 domain-containing protein n=1 Tax=Pararhizobium haloflavum TaxID=2037914 RepID=UPI000C19C352|nr:DUF2460 domain-containing protein [Pararhizobium haloflavum]